LIVILVAIAVCLLLLGIWSALHPYDALILLLGLLVFHSGAVHVLQNVFQMDSRLLLLLSSWKEVVIAGVVVAALVRFRRRPFRPDFIALVVIAFLGLIGIRVALDMVARVGLSDELLGARNASEFAILFLAVTILAPDVAWLRRASWVLVPLVLLAAEVGIVQLLFGFRFYNVLYHAPGEVLTSAFSAKFGGLIVPRAVGTYTAPNEFGLGLVIYLVAILLPLAFTRLNSATRTLLAVAATLACLALALTYSRSAWLGVALAVPVVALLLRRPIARWVDAHRRRGMAHMRMMTMCLAAIVVLVGGVFVVSGGFRFLVTTLTGQEASAAGRPTSLSNGIEALLSHPLGGGLTSAGPKAKSLNPTAVLTENWYLVYGIQLGWLALAALCTFAAACLVSLARRVNATLTSIDAVTERVAFQVGAIGALLAALGGALFIPALLDLPASLTVWTFVAVALVPATVEPVDAPTRLDTAEAQPPADPAT
jgi:hypothetical protein